MSAALKRLAAVLALAAPIYAVAAGVEYAFTRPADLIVLAVAVLLLTVAVWYALTRRGLLRLVAILLAVVTSPLVLLIGLSVFLTQIGLLVIFVVTSRYALGPDAAARFAKARLAGAARQGVLLINPRSGNGKATRLSLDAEADRRGIRPVVLTPGDDLLDLAEQAVADGADVIGMAGGDGSQALVASVAMRRGVAFVCVPSGTRNHFALDLGLDRSDVVGALDAYTDGVERTIDLGLVNDRVFVNNASLGVYAQVVQSAAYRNAKARTWGRLLPDLLGPTAAPLDLEFQGPDSRRYVGLPLVLVSNNPYRLSRLARSGGRPKLDTGRLGILAARAHGTGLLEWSLPDFEVQSHADVPVGLDGEALVLVPPLRFVSLPGALRVRVPRTARGGRRARRNAALTRDDLTALVRIAAGRPPVSPDRRPADQAIPASG